MLHSTFVCVISFFPFLSFPFLHFHVFVFTLVSTPLVVDSHFCVCTSHYCSTFCMCTFCQSLIFAQINQIAFWCVFQLAIQFWFSTSLSRIVWKNITLDITFLVFLMEMNQKLIKFSYYSTIFFLVNFLITYSTLSLDIGPNHGVLHVVFKFLFTKFDEEHWIQKICMSKENVFYICEELKPFIKKQDTKCRNENVMCSFQIGSNSKPFIL